MPIWKINKPAMGHLARSFSLNIILLLILCSASESVLAQRAFTRRFPASAAPSLTTRGDILLIGNTNLTCNTATAGCSTAQNGTTGNNGGFGVLALVDIDGLAATTNSSRATLTIPVGSTVLFAGLYWGSGAAPSVAARTSVLFQTPTTGYATVNASVTDVITNAYQSFADVTAQVINGGSGVYGVGNVGLTTAAGNWGGWSLVVVYQDTATGNLRNMSVFDGYQRGNTANPQIDISVSGFITPPAASGPVLSDIGLVLYDGDRAVNDSATAGAASLLFGPSTASLSNVFNTVNPVTDVFNSSISINGGHITAGRSPNFNNTFGIDIDVFQPNVPLANGSTSAVVRLRASDGDVNYPGVITLANNVFEPDVLTSFSKTATDVNGAPYRPDDEVIYSITFTNSGNDGASNMVITDPLPANTSFVSGSLEIVSGANAGLKTDAVGDDQAEFNGTQIVFRAGIGATGATGGTVPAAPAADSTTELRFRVKINSTPIVPDGTTITNVANVAFTGATTGSAYSGSAPPVNLIVVNQADLVLTKSNAVTTLISGSTTNYTLSVTNNGPSAANGAVIADPVTAGLSCTAVDCTATSGAQCPGGVVNQANVVVPVASLQAGIAIPTLPNGGNVSFVLTCTVTATGL